ncbi:MAG: DCC1-like thiol-disulfide oxidoreductase family protein, partial [Campylobacterota bacterium]
MKTLQLYFDKECPFCKNYATYLQLQKNYAVQLKDARQYPKEIEQLRQSGYDIDEGVIVVLEGQTFHGVAAIELIDTLSHDKRFLTKLIRFLIRLKLLKVLYPL